MIINIKYLDKVDISADNYFVINLFRKPFSSNYFEKRFNKLEDAIEYISKHKKFLLRLSNHKNAFNIYILNYSKKNDDCPLLAAHYMGKILNRNTIQFAKYSGESRSIKIAHDLSQVYSESFVIKSDFAINCFAYDYDVLYGDGLKWFKDKDRVRFKEYEITTTDGKIIDKIYLNTSSMCHGVNGIDKMDEMWDGSDVNCDFTCDANVSPDYEEGWDYISVPITVYPCAQFELTGRAEDDPDYWGNWEKKDGEEEG